MNNTEGYYSPTETEEIFDLCWMNLAIHSNLELTHVDDAAFITGLAKAGLTCSQAVNYAHLRTQ